jgi:hypothetical protein
MNWIKQIKPMDLITEAPQIQILDFSENYSIDDAAALMVQGAPQFFASIKTKEKEQLLKGKYRRSHEKLPPKEWWPKVKYEFHVFLCTDDKRYEDLRKKLNESVSATSTTILSAISAAIGCSLGFEAGAIVGLVAVCLYAVIKIGKEAYCAIAHSI